MATPKEKKSNTKIDSGTWQSKSSLPTTVTTLRELYRRSFDASKEVLLVPSKQRNIIKRPI